MFHTCKHGSQRIIAMPSSAANKVEHMRTLWKLLLRAKIWRDTHGQDMIGVRLVGWIHHRHSRGYLPAGGFPYLGYLFKGREPRGGRGYPDKNSWPAAGVGNTPTSRRSRRRSNHPVCTAHARTLSYRTVLWIKIGFASAGVRISTPPRRPPACGYTASLVMRGPPSAHLPTGVLRWPTNERSSGAPMDHKSRKHRWV